MRRVFVAGVPAPQGSKRHVGNGRMIESSKAVGPWRERIGSVLDAQNLPDPPRTDIEVHLTFQFLRPKSHFTARGELKTGAPWHPTTRPDIDKLARAALDAMTGRLFVDDAQVVALLAQKTYANKPGLWIEWDAE